MRRLVLVGGGHAHLNVIKSFRSFPREDLEIILISESEKQYYSGMVSGLLEGYYTEEEMSIDLPVFCENNDATFIRHRVDQFDPKSRVVYLEKGETIRYDYISFNIGSQTDVGRLVLNENSYLVKPLYWIRDLRDRVIDICQIKSSDEVVHILVIGTGAAGVEVGLAAKNLILSAGKNGKVTFIGSRERALHNFSPKAYKLLSELCKEDVWINNTYVEGVYEESVVLNTGEEIRYDLLVFSTGVRSSDLFKVSGMLCDQDGFMVVNDQLQSLEYPNIFGAGDCIRIDRYMGLEKNGVYAIRQSEILAENLKNIIGGSVLKSFNPQKKYLAILALKENLGLLIYGNIVRGGKLAFLVKKFIDTSYMKKM